MVGFLLSIGQTVLQEEPGINVTIDCNVAVSDRKISEFIGTAAVSVATAELRSAGQARGGLPYSTGRATLRHATGSTLSPVSFFSETPRTISTCGRRSAESVRN